MFGNLVGVVKVYGGGLERDSRALWGLMDMFIYWVRGR